MPITETIWLQVDALFQEVLLYMYAVGAEIGVLAIIGQMMYKSSSARMLKPREGSPPPPAPFGLVPL